MFDLVDCMPSDFIEESREVLSITVMLGNEYPPNTCSFVCLLCSEWIATSKRSTDHISDTTGGERDGWERQNSSDRLSDAASLLPGRR